MTVSSDTSERVVLVDEGDTELGTAPKLDTHRRGELHRAFSIFLFDRRGRTLIQKRAPQKYHSGGKWANTCCGHPRPDEPIARAAKRRLGEELGMSAELTPGFISRYRAELDGEMIENELVHIFYGIAGSEPAPNAAEASAVDFVELAELKAGSAIPVSHQTAWLRHYLEHHFEALLDIRHRLTDQSHAIDKHKNETDFIRKFV
ncbi:MAG: isopentenyl-diphosphate Delta-isomerase [Henriciella sp.]|uniref:isopentenyl-diphosphate Delta-isomerase n=1 Tax=Henriciella sp. TaxID=1968823 RepID=UPI003C7249F7